MNEGINNINNFSETNPAAIPDVESLPTLPEEEETVFGSALEQGDESATPPIDSLENVLPAVEAGEINAMEVAEQDAILDLVAQKMSEEGEVITKEELAASTDPVVQERFDTFLDRHPKVRKLVQIFALSTALGVPMAAQAQGQDGRALGGIVIQAITQEANTEVNSRIQRGQVQEQQRVQQENANLHAQQAMERFDIQQQQERERFDTGRESARQQLMLRNPSPQQIDQFEIGWDSRYVQMLQRQKQTRDTYMSTLRTQQQQQELRIAQQNRQLEQQRSDARVRNVTGAINQVGGIFTQRIYRGH